jgi:hypothetical protein
MPDGNEFVNVETRNGTTATPDVHPIHGGARDAVLTPPAVRPPHHLVSSDRLTTNVTLKQSAEQRDAHAEAEPLVHAGTGPVNTHASSGAGGLDLALAADACPIPLVATYSHPHLTILSSSSGFSSQATQQQHNQIKPTNPPTGDWWVFV